MIEYTKNWEQLDVPFDTCRRCMYGEYVVDPYGTGDSPPGVECNANNESQCPYMDQFEIDIDKLENIKLVDVFISERYKYESAYIESAEYGGSELPDDMIEWVNENHPEKIMEEAQLEVGI